MDAASRFARWTLLAAALAFAVPGLGFLIAPGRFASLVDVALLGPNGWSDARAVFGGLELGVAAFLALCAASRPWQRAGLVASLFCVGGLLAGRVASLLHDGAPGALGWLLFAIEVALSGATVAALAWRGLGAREAGSS